MTVVPENIKSELKTPLGRIGKPEELPELAKKLKIISVGDISTLKCIEAGVIPFIAVYDLIFMRKPLDQQRRQLLSETFPNALRASNPPGEITCSFVDAAKSIIKTGGAIQVDGEEDLTALVLVALSDSKSLVIYGQPHQGMVFIEPNLKTKNKAKEILKELKLL
ncbi:MAG: DUF359 domain-containing protein [Candidatus Micrarchaeia archaeon]|jgi:hypothetical protein